MVPATLATTTRAASAICPGRSWLPFAPDWSLSIFADVRHPVGSRLALLAGLDIAASDGYVTDGTLDPAAAQGSWVRVSARLGLAAADDRWSSGPRS